MPLEATMLIIDNSEYMRNGDYPPTRYDAQSDAVNTVFQAKIDSNPENTAGLMTMAGNAPEVLVTHTKELGQILASVHAASHKLAGFADIPTAIAIAQLALKHRQNKNLRQRIIVFLGSPLEGQGADERAMVKLAKKLKKNNVAIDIVTFGDGIEEGESHVLRSFVDAASSGDNSRLLSCPPGNTLLSEMIQRSPILAGDFNIPEGLDDNVGTGAAGGDNNFEFGFDPTMDPELAAALRMSMQEEEARQAAAAAASEPAATATPVVESRSAALPVTPARPSAAPADPTDDEEEALLQQALAMSKQDEDVEMGAEDDDEVSEEEAIARAIAMSMEDAEPETPAPKKK